MAFAYMVAMIGIHTLSLLCLGILVELTLFLNIRVKTRWLMIGSIYISTVRPYGLVTADAYFLTESTQK